MATRPVLADRDVSIGRVFGRSFSTIRHNPVVVLGLALLLGALPGIALLYLISSIGLGSDPDNLSSSAVTGIFGVMFIYMVFSLAISAIVQGALTRATVSETEGRRASFGESLSVGLRFFLPLIGVGIIFGLGVVLGMILLIVPGIIILLMWAVAAPALVIEREGVFRALSRSGELTKGARWKILGLFLVLLVVYYLLSMVLGAIGLDQFSATQENPGISPTALIGSVVLGTLYNAVWGTIQPSLYVELRHWKEGDSSEVLEQVFA